jgi:hypothetical protein
MRTQLTCQYQRWLDQAKHDCARLLTSAAQTMKVECRQRLDADIAAFWSEQHQRSFAREQKSSIVLALIERRRTNIEHCLKRIYELTSALYIRMPMPVMSLIDERSC